MAKILIIDDSALSRRILRKMLEGAGHQVLEAGNGIGGLECYFLERPDLTILDLTMPDMHGLDVLTRLRQLDPQARVVIATADIQSSTRALAVEAGAAGFLNKPLTADALLQAVAAVLGQA